MIEPWKLAAIDQAGYNGIRPEHIRAVAAEIVDIGQPTVNWAVFERACRRCGIEPDNFTQEDLDELQEQLDKM